MQLEQLAGVVLVDRAHGVPVVVEIAQHGRLAQGGFEKIAEAAQGVGTDGLVFIVAHGRPDVVLEGQDVEVVQPEPGHLLLELVGRIEVAP